ncbi:MAG TPA: HAMP domain-containing methyl-accepting chemotaxis protein [Rectinemataceae bacterium]|nr:HAMP domain-containing methyl-accepting chemotaxis protein [Rectinemataceae bacterium]
MKLRIFAGLSILAKLVMLSLIVAAALAANFYASWKSLDRLAATIRNQADNSSLQTAASQFERDVFGAALSLYRVEEAALEHSNEVTASITSFSQSLDLSSFSLDKLSALPSTDDIKSDLQDITKAYGQFRTAALEAMPALRDGSPAARTKFMICAVRLDALDANLVKLGDVIKQNSQDAASSGRSAAANAAQLVAIVLAAVLAFVLVFVVLMVRSIMKPLGMLVSAVDTVGSGDLRIAAIEAGGGEFGQIAACVDGLAVDLRCLIGVVKERIAGLESTGQGLAAAMEETGASVIQINSNIANTKSQLSQQSQAVREVNDSIEELRKSVETLAGRITEQSEVIGHSSASVEELIANVESVASQAMAATYTAQELAAEGSDGKARIDEVGEAVASIVRSSKNLEEAALVITEIADRTNILAMNAAIEAAHAGEAGRGFAVVADEIRKLAEQSTLQAKGISTGLSTVTSAIESVSSAAGSAIASFAMVREKSDLLGGAVNSIGTAMAEQRQGGTQVLETLVRLKDLTYEITRDSDRMARANSMVLQPLERLQSITMTVVQNNDEITTGTKEINDAIGVTIDLSSRNSSHIREVKEAIDKFQI